MTRTLCALVLTAMPLAALAQSPGEEVRRLFEAGKYQQVIAAVAPDSAPLVVYLAGRSSERLRSSEEAGAWYDRLIARPDSDPWQGIGSSARQMLDNQLPAALTSARQALSKNDSLAEAHYQLGLVLARQQAWAEAAGVFDRASALDPRLAYAYYYGGLMYSRASQPARMAVRFEQFLRVAPDAPERPEVIQILRTARR